jgi:hypothetical protein
VVKQGRRQLEEQMAQERAERERRSAQGDRDLRTPGWDRERVPGGEGAE